MNAVSLPFDQGIEQERVIAADLFLSGQARALQYAFFAQRAATKVSPAYWVLCVDTVKLMCLFKYCRKYMTNCSESY